MGTYKYINKINAHGGDTQSNGDRLAEHQITLNLNITFTMFGNK